MNIALIMAGGNGSRMNSSVPKQFLSVLDKPVIIHTMEVFENCSAIDGIFVVCLDGWQDKLLSYAKSFNITKFVGSCTGGSDGQSSIRNGILALKDMFSLCDVILIHDSVRPNVSNECILDSIEKCKLYGSGVSVTSCLDSVLETEDKITSTSFLNRERLMVQQTPQTFSLEKLIFAYDEAAVRGICNMSSAANLMVSLGEKVYFSLGSQLNLKLTTLEDLEIFKALLYMKGSKLC